jgi:DNA modification methylase
MENLFDILQTEVEPDNTPKRQYKALLPLDTNRTVIDQFGVLPVSIFKPQKRPEWDALIDDEGDPLETRRSSDSKYLPNLRYSKFHPDLAEFCIKYWSNENDLIIDPFAGRATRGIVALKLGRKYHGYEVAPSTYALTKPKIEALGGLLYQSDGCQLKEIPDNTADFVFTCPPYQGLEKYEPCPDQLSDIKDYDVFLGKMATCCQNVHRVLKTGRFAVIVVADWRDGKAFRVFHADLIGLMANAWMEIWDIMVVHNNSPFASLQAGKVAAKRYTSKTHEYALIFRKGG